MRILNSSQPLCAECSFEEDEHEMATHLCTSCPNNTFLCYHHSKKHKKQSHNVQELTNIDNPLHQQQPQQNIPVCKEHHHPMNMFCICCNSLLCLMCTYSLVHKSHSQHVVILEEIKETKCKELEQQKNNIHQQYCENFFQFKTVDEITKIHQSNTQLITEKFKQLRKTLDEMEQKYLQEDTEIKNQRVEILNQILSISQSLDNDRNLTTSQMNVYEILDKLDKLTKNIQHVSTL